MGFWRSCFSEGDGTGSMSRVLSTFFGVSAVGWISYLVHINKALPDLIALAAFVSMPYGINQLKMAVSNVAAAKPPDPSKGDLPIKSS